MERYRERYFYGCMGGLGLCIVEFICSILPYIKISDLLYTIWLITSISIGVALSVFVILYKRTSLSEMIFRFGVMVASYVIVGVVNGYVGITRFLYDILDVDMSSSRDNVSGMLTFTFWTIIISICIVVIIVVTITSLGKKTRDHSTRTRKT